MVKNILKKIFWTIWILFGVLIVALFGSSSIGLLEQGTVGSTIIGSVFLGAGLYILGIYIIITIVLLIIGYIIRKLTR